jgi:hypothetical protein
MPLPNPADLHRKQLERNREMAADVAPRLLYVDSVTSGLVTLREADGTVIGEDVAWIGSVSPQAGDAVVAIQIPGRGHKHARGSRVALGPVNRSGVAGIVEREASASVSITPSNSVTSSYEDAITLSIPLGAGTWDVTAIGDLALIHSAGTKCDIRIVVAGNQTERQTQNLHASIYSRWGVSRRETGLTGGGSVTVTLQYRPFNTGTAGAANPMLHVIAIQTA